MKADTLGIDRNKGLNIKCYTDINREIISNYFDIFIETLIKNCRGKWR